MILQALHCPHCPRLVMVSFTYMRSEADRVLTPLPLVLVFVSP
jgi:hypothetical protein